MAFGGSVTATCTKGTKNPNNDHEIAQAATESITCLEWSPVANHLLSGAWDGELRLWDVSGGNPNGLAATKHGAPILCTTWTGDGKKAFTGGCDNQVKLWDIQANSSQQVAQHDGPIQAMAWNNESALLVTGSWDSTLKFWDLRQGITGSPAHTCQLPGAVFAMDTNWPLCVVACGTRDNTVVVYDLTSPNQPHSTEKSHFAHQTRSVACFKVGMPGYVLGSIEGRVRVNYIEPAHKEKEFAFKAHRDDNAPGGSTVYAVNSMAMHLGGGFATTGSDGRVCFWDKDNKQRLKQFGICNYPVTCCGFNGDGKIFAYASSYDWSKGAGPYNMQQGTHQIFLHSVTEKEIIPKARK